MKRIPTSKIHCAIVMIAFVFCSFAQAAITPAQMAAKMGLGVSSSWSRTTGQMGRYTTYETEQFASKGVGHIRIRTPMDANSTLFNGPSNNGLDRQVQDVLDSGMVAVIAHDTAYWEENPNSSNLTRWKNWWDAIATHYRNYPDDLIFNLIVELDGSSPASKDDGTILNNAYEQIVSKIRQTNPTRIIVIQPQRRGDPHRFNILDMPSQGNGYIMGEWHEGYASGPKPVPNENGSWTTGTASERAAITDRIDAALDWVAPTWEGALMPGNYNKGDDYTIAEQIEFITFFCTELNNAGIPCCLNATGQYWDQDSASWISGRVDVLEAAIACYDTGGGNSPPEFNSNNINKPNATEGSAYSASIANNASDPDGDALTFSAQSGPSWLNVAANGSLSGTPGSADVGDNSWTVRVTDGNGGSDTATLHITVNSSGGGELTANAGPDQTVEAGSGGTASVTLDGSASTGDITLYRWKEGSTILGDGVTLTVNFSIGVHTIKLKVKDSSGDILFDYVDITVVEGGTGNTPPAFNSNNINKPDATENSAYSASIANNASDPDGDSLTFSKVSGPGWLSVASNGSLSGTPGSGDVGANSWTVRVSDGNGGSDTATLNITVVEDGGGTLTTILNENFNNDANGWSLDSARHTTNDAKVYAGAGALQINKAGKAWRTISTVGYTDIELTCALRTDNFESSESLRVQWHNGSSWQTLETFRSSVNKEYELRTYSLPSGAANKSSFQLRFKSNSSSSEEKAYVDSLVLSGIN